MREAVFWVEALAVVEELWAAAVEVVDVEAVGVVERLEAAELVRAAGALETAGRGAVVLEADRPVTGVFGTAAVVGRVTVIIVLAPSGPASSAVAMDCRSFSPFTKKLSSTPVPGRMGEGCKPRMPSGFLTISAGSTDAGWEGTPKAVSAGTFPAAPLFMGDPAGVGLAAAVLMAETAFLGENTKIAAPITMTRKTPTETATNNNFFFSISLIPSP